METIKLPFRLRDIEEIKGETEEARRRLRKRNGKIITGEEYELSENCYYRGTLFGSVVCSMYCFDPPVLRRLRGGIDIFVDTDPGMPVKYANFYASNSEVVKHFEKEQKREGFDFPAGGAILLEIPKEKAKKSKKPVERWQYGILLQGPVPVYYLTENCKEYILSELGFGKDSFAYKILFEEI